VPGSGDRSGVVQADMQAMSFRSGSLRGVWCRAAALHIALSDVPTGTVSSLAEAARLAEAVAQVPGLEGALMTLADGHVTARLTRGVFRPEKRHVELARAISAVAREHAATADRTNGARGAVGPRGPA
jgi:hypothetical protein